MKIAHVTPLLDGRGGVQTYVREIAAGLAGRGHDVTVFVLGAKEPATEIEGCDIKWIRIRPQRLLGRYTLPANLVEFRRRLTGFDIVHAHQPFVGDQRKSRSAINESRGRGVGFVLSG